MRRVRQVACVAAAASVVAMAGCSKPADPPPAVATPVVATATTDVTAVPTVTATVPTTSVTTSAPAPATAVTGAPPTTPAPAGWAPVVRKARPAVVRFDVATCDQRGGGSGFFVDDDLILTAAHVVDGASALTIQYDGGGVTTASVLGIDFTTDSALLRTDEPVAPGTLTLSATAAEPGLAVGILGFPLWTFTLHVTQGIVSGVGSVEYADFTVDNVLVTDAAINGGNSGGPVVDQSGEVVGLVTGKRMWVSGDRDDGAAEGMGFVVPASALAANLDRWRIAEPQPLVSCEDSAPPATDVETIAVEILSDSPIAPDLARSLTLHGQGINLGQYEVAWSVFTPGMQAAMGDFDSWQQDLVTSYWDALTVLEVSGDEMRAQVKVVLRTTQDAAYGPDGQTCSDWPLTYTMVNSQGGWLIDKVKAAGASAAC